MKRLIFLSLFAVASLLCFVGCSSSDNQLQDLGAKYLLNEEPSDLKSVLEARESLGQDDIVVLGRVGSQSHDTFQPGKAAFVITDTSVEISDHDHAGGDHSDCPFCKAKEGKGPDPSAIVQIVDDGNQVLEHDAQKLLGVEEGQLVVVKGKGRIDETLGLYYVSADGIYVRK